MEKQIVEKVLSPHFEELKFEDGGVYCGGTYEGKAHGYGICTGPGGEGQYSGAWLDGFEVNGSYVWPNGNAYHGQWMQGKRHGLGMEKRGHWIYQGELTNGLFGKYGVKKHQYTDARYEGTWSSGVQCGYGVETYLDKGTYIGQWLKGVRHGYGIRTSSVFQSSATSPQSYALSRKFSLTTARSEPEIVIKEENDSSEPKSIIDFFPPVPPPHIHEKFYNVKPSPVNRIGFFLKGKFQDQSKETQNSKYTDKMNSNFKAEENQNFSKNSSTDVQQGSDSAIKNIISKMSLPTNSLNLLDLNSVPANAYEIYSGEWKNDKRNGYGVCQRSDGLKYEGEWNDNCKNGYGITTFSDGTKEEGCYKNNVLLEQIKRLNVLKLGKTKEQVEAAVNSSNKAAQIASQKAEIAISRANTSINKMEQAIQVVDKAILDSKVAQCQLAAFLQQNLDENTAFGKTTKKSTFGSSPVLHEKDDRQKFQKYHYKSAQHLVSDETTNVHHFLKSVQNEAKSQPTDLVTISNNLIMRNRRLTLPSFSCHNEIYSQPKDLTKHSSVKQISIGDGQRCFLITSSYKLDQFILPKYKLVPTTLLNKSNIQSLPDVTIVNKLETSIIPKSEAITISKKIRDNNVKMKDLEQKLRKNAIVIKLGDIKAWLTNHKIEIFVVFINIFVSSFFYNLLFK